MSRLPDPDPMRRLSIAFLKSLHLLHRVHDIEAYVEIGGRAFQLSVDRKGYELRVEYLYNEQRIVQVIELPWVRTSFGYRPYLFCLKTQTYCNEMVFMYGHFASHAAFAKDLGVKGASPAVRKRRQVAAKAARLIGGDGRGPARGRNRAKLISELTADPLIRLGDPELDDFLLADEKKAVNKARRAYRERQQAPSLADALGNGSGLAYGRAYERQRSTPASVWLSEFPPSWEPEAGRPIACLEHALALDIRAISEHFELRQKVDWAADQVRLWGVELAWPSELTGVARMQLFLDLRDSFHSCVIIRREFDDWERATEVETIRVEQRLGSRRWWLLCPATGKRCDLLYLRDDRFASASAQRLVHQSQRSRLPRT